MGKKSINTPSSRIRSAIRMVFLRSRERAAVLKKAKYCCSKCGIKQTRAGKDKTKWVYLEVHHITRIDIWKKVIDLIAKEILESPQIALCKSCHKKEHENETKPKIH